jgi:hypothetical protein
MKKALIVVGFLLIVGLTGGWVVTYQALGATQLSLQAMQTSLDQVQATLQTTTQSLDQTRQDLSQTQTQLVDTKKSLEQTQQTLAEQKGQTAKYIQLNESTEAQLKSKELELAASQQGLQKLQQQLDEAKKSLQLYKDTLGTQVFSAVRPPYVSGNLKEITLINNSAATNPTWKQLEAFLLADKTDKRLYVPGVYECGNFAQELHNNAEARGIRTAFVAISFQTGIPHALNAFKTLDMGLVFIDVTGMPYSIGLSNLDTKVQLKKGEPYIGSLIFPDGWGLGSSTVRIVKSIEIYW